MLEFISVSKKTHFTLLFCVQLLPFIVAREIFLEMGWRASFLYVIVFCKSVGGAGGQGGREGSLV